MRRWDLTASQTLRLFLGLQRVSLLSVEASQTELHSLVRWYE